MKLFDRIRQATSAATTLPTAFRQAMGQGEHKRAVQEPMRPLTMLSDIITSPDDPRLDANKANKSLAPANKSTNNAPPKRARRPDNHLRRPTPEASGDVKPARGSSAAAPTPRPAESPEPADRQKRGRGRPAVKTDARSIAARERMRLKRAKGAQ